MDKPRPLRGVLASRVFVSVVCCVLLLVGAAVGVSLIFATEPEAVRDGAVRESAALVQTLAVRKGDHRPRFITLGRVEPAREVVFSSRVEGQIEQICPVFVPGGIVEKGRPLAVLDDSDYKQSFAIRQAERDQVKMRLDIERGIQRVARMEYESFGEEIGEENRGLVLREPQIAALQSELASAEASVELARLQVKRTRVEAPFDAQVLTRLVDVGSQLAPGQPLGRLVGTREYWVIATLPLRHLPWIELEAGAATPDAAIRHTTAWPTGESRSGRVEGLIGTIDPETRLARLRISVADPLARDTPGMPLVLETIVEVAIQGRALPGCFRVRRDHLRQNETLWIDADGKLEVREVVIAVRDAEYVYITEGLQDGDHIVTSTLATVTPGIPLRRATLESAALSEADP